MSEKYHEVDLDPDYNEENNHYDYVPGGRYYNRQKAEMRLGKLERGKINMGAQLELKVLAGAESKQFLADLSDITERLEKVAKTLKGAKGEPDEDDEKPVKKKGKKDEDFDDEEKEAEDEENENEDDEEFEPRKKGKSKKDEFEDEEKEDEDNDDEDEAPAKKGKSKLTTDDVNDACKKRAARTTRAEVVGILKKLFKVKSVNDLEPEQYAAVIKAMGKK